MDEDVDTNQAWMKKCSIAFINNSQKYDIKVIYYMTWVCSRSNACSDWLILKQARKACKSYFFN